MSTLMGSVWKIVPDLALFEQMERGVGHDHDAVASATSVRYITADGEVTVPLLQADAEQIDGGQMVRSIPKYKGRKNYSGLAWTATGARSVPYESMLERSRIFVADFDESVVGITSQGIELSGRTGSTPIRRFPDLFLLRAGAPPLVVDVTAEANLYDAKRIDRFCWTAAAVRGAGWDYEVWCGADSIAMANLMLLNGYKRRSVINHEVLAELLSAGRSGELARIEHELDSRHYRFDVVAAVRHALWTGLYEFDVSTPLDADTWLTFVGGRP